MKRTKGLGRIYQPTFRDRATGELKHSPTWWIAVSHHGKRYQFSSHSEKHSDAVKVLKAKLAELGAGRPIGPDVDRTTFEDLAAMVVADYEANGRRSARLLKGKLANLRQAFGLELARDITADRITSYVASRRLSGAANATINRDLACLKRAFRLAHRAGRVAGVPHISLLHEENRRKGFFEDEQFRAVLDHLPADLRPVVLTAYVTGWRIDSEILTRQRKHLDLQAGWLRLEPGETKNGEGRMFPLTPELRAVLEAQLVNTREMEKASGRIIPWLFHRDGEPIKSFRRSWLSACKAAGVPGRLRHDFRRTAVRNLERAGVSRSDAMAMVGHRTVSIYYRYAIADEKSLKAAAEKLAALHGQMSTPGLKGEALFAKALLKQTPAAASGGGEK